MKGWLIALGLFVAAVIFVAAFPLFQKTPSFTGFYFQNSDIPDALRTLRPDLRSDRLKSDEECQTWGYEVRKTLKKGWGEKEDLLICAKNCYQNIFSKKWRCDFENSPVYSFSYN